MFSKRLFQLRKKKGLTQKELADELGVTPSVISRLEHGKEEVSLEMYGEISHFFNVSIDYLVGQTDVTNIYEVVTLYEELNDTERGRACLGLIKSVKENNISPIKLKRLVKNLTDDESEKKQEMYSEKNNR